MQLKPLDQQVVVLMGASSGIGRLTAERFAQRGARVVVAARNEAGLHDLVETIRASGGTALAVPADTADFAQVRHVADRAVEQFGRIDTWVQLAGVAMYARFDETTAEEWQQIIDVNLNGQAYGAMAALPHLKREGRGALIHIVSVLGKRAVPLQSAYSASKHGIVGMIDALRVELMQSRTPVSVTGIFPASINSTFFERARTKMDVEPAPYPPAYPPTMVADAILYAATHPTRDMYVGDVGRLLSAVQHVTPGLIDGILAVTGTSLQQTNAPRLPSAPDAVFTPIPSSTLTTGAFTDRTISVSAYPWVDMQQAALIDAGRLLLLTIADTFGAFFRAAARPPVERRPAPPAAARLEIEVETNGVRGYPGIRP